MEWGCMQALIDFDGWKKWKDFSSQNTNENNASGGGMTKSARRIGGNKRERQRTGGPSTPTQGTGLIGNGVNGNGGGSGEPRGIENTPAVVAVG